jgi:hypothetical protein
MPREDVGDRTRGKSLSRGTPHWGTIERPMTNGTREIVTHG